LDTIGSLRKKFGIISEPLTDLLKKDRVFQCNLEQTESFEALKYALVHAPVLAIPNFAMPFIIETDSSEIDVGGVLMQDHHLLAFVSKALGPKLMGLSTYEKEYVAILLAVEQWKSYM
jgi:hypothetical protein